MRAYQKKRERAVEKLTMNELFVEAQKSLVDLRQLLDDVGGFENTTTLFGIILPKSQNAKETRQIS